MITDHLRNVCKIGQKEQTCRYLYAGQTGFECVKLDQDFKHLQDQRVEKGIAAALGQGTGDNCDGVTDKAILNDMDYINKKLNED
jgi:hypothetical protein